MAGFFDNEYSQCSFCSVKYFSVQRAVDEWSPMLIRLESTGIVFQFDIISRIVSEEKRKVADRFFNPS